MRIEITHSKAHQNTKAPYKIIRIKFDFCPSWRGQNGALINLWDTCATSFDGFKVLYSQVHGLQTHGSNPVYVSV